MAIRLSRRYAFPQESTIREARAFIREHHITGILIEEAVGSGRLAGLLSNRDIPWIDGFENEPVSRFMTPLNRLTTAAPGIEVHEAERIMFEKRIEKLPLVDQTRQIAGLITKKDVIMYRQRPHYSKDSKGRLLVGAAIGARGDYLERGAALIAGGVDVLVIDIAHGHAQIMQTAVEACRKSFDPIPLICGERGNQCRGSLSARDRSRCGKGRDRTWTRLPYPLGNCCGCTPVASHS